jgi:hypothetical protein
MGVPGTPSYRWIILLVATLVQVGVSSLQQAPAALGPVLTRDLDLTRAQIGILSSAIWGGMLFTMPPVGLIADLTGSYGASWLGLAGWTAVGIALGLLARESREGANP